jgi:UDP-N-acetylglucosamine--N-acetylmuramyl-(pentapeptide) pyrophosphoryl-undecaprenol N-acetylglucosamine transferase
MSLAGTRGGSDYPKYEGDASGARFERRLAIAAGGTAGHITVGLAIAEAYRQAFDDVSVCFIGTPAGLEERLVPSAGYPLEIVAGTPVAGESSLGKSRALWNLAAGARQARRVLVGRRTRLMIGCGGYASAGALFAARSLGLRVAIQEANIQPGMANRLLSRLANRVYLGFEAAAGSIGGSKARVTGNPIRSEIARTGASRRQRAHTDNEPARVIVMGGSLGSRFLNDQVPKLLERIVNLGVSIEVRHQTGIEESAPIAATYEAAGISAHVEAFISDMADTYQWADFAITSAGALTLAELAACGLPALLIPLRDAAADHQAANAKAFADRTGGWWVTEEDWDPIPLADRISSLLRGTENWQSASKRVRELANPDAARALIADCEELMSGQW